MKRGSSALVDGGGQGDGVGWEGVGVGKGGKEVAAVVGDGPI